MSKTIKNMIMKEFSSRLGDARDLLVLDSSKMDAISTNKLRLELKKSNIRAMVVPNALTKRLLTDMGLSALNPYLVGPSTVVWGGQDIVALSKEITKWAKQIEELEIKGGAVEGRSVSPADVEALSKSPSREELLGKIVGIMLSPASKLAGALLGSGGTVCGAIKAKAEKEEEAPAPAA